MNTVRHPSSCSKKRTKVHVCKCDMSRIQPAPASPCGVAAVGRNPKWALDEPQDMRPQACDHDDDNDVWLVLALSTERL